MDNEKKNFGELAEVAIIAAKDTTIGPFIYWTMTNNGSKSEVDGILKQRGVEGELLTSANAFCQILRDYPDGARIWWNDVCGHFEAKPLVGVRPVRSIRSITWWLRPRDAMIASRFKVEITTATEELILPLNRVCFNLSPSLFAPRALVKRRNDKKPKACTVEFPTNCQMEDELSALKDELDSMDGEANIKIPLVIIVLALLCAMVTGISALFEINNWLCINGAKTFACLCTLFISTILIVAKSGEWTAYSRLMLPKGSHATIQPPEKVEDPPGQKESATA